MLTILRDLTAHKGHANAALLNSIRQSETASCDLELRALFHHILVANRFWLLLILGKRFVAEVETRVPDSLDALIADYRLTQQCEAEWLANATDADLARILESPLIPGGRCSVSHALIQVCLHSPGHRAQCAKILRRLGGTPPPTDFILWLADRPESE